MKNRLAYVGLAVGLAGGTLAGITLGAPGLVGAQGESPVPATATADPGMPGPGKPDPSTWFKGAIDPLVANGTITQSQADAVIAALKKTMPQGKVRVFRQGPLDLETAAQKIGITPDALKQALGSGQSIAGVATSKGVDPQVVIDALVGKEKSDLSSQVKAGTLTQAEADQRLAKEKVAITEMVNGQLPMGKPGLERRVFPPGVQPPGPGLSTSSAPAGA
jgi:hypothetical protein